MDEKIKELERRIAEGKDGSLLLQLGELYYTAGRTIDALNAFNTVLRTDPDNTKARTYVVMINNVLNYYNKDLLNP